MPTIDYRVMSMAEESEQPDTLAHTGTREEADACEEPAKEGAVSGQGNHQGVRRLHAMTVAKIRPVCVEEGIVTQSVTVVTPSRLARNAFVWLFCPDCVQR
ncbi:MAG TPA: hypothetical protein PKN13_03880 [Accumulibacter sp.]|nr:hypothetical protein [Accumulibacter sp.]HMW16828.1 hypothetical protein [Accumulibacter sp.]HMX21655.1 hypothetical protein [Accumulibacter sp.]HMY05734.1 hypothetical protein [Accumulibacter sp.]HNC17075.1 hypothetical protein [Accumulibacter sp.]